MKQEHTEEVWKKIPGLPDKYELSSQGRVRAWYNYEGHTYKPHWKLLSPDGNNVEMDRRKCNVPRLMQQVYGVNFCEDRPGETWLDVKGYEDLYQVSNMGRIRSKAKIVECKNGHSYYQHERFIKFCKINSGYFRVKFHKEQKVKGALVHRVVAEHFLPNPQGLEQVNHKNEDKLDNRAENLEWCDKVYNCLYGTCQERRITTRLRNNNGRYGVSRKSTRGAGFQE